MLSTILITRLNGSLNVRFIQ